MSTDTPLADAAQKVDKAVQKPASLLPPDQRLEASRAALRLAMQTKRGAATATGAPPTGRLGSIGAALGGVTGHPVIATLRDTVRQWWLTHPWRPALIIGAEAANQLAVPIARRHPLRLLAVALAAGAVLSRLKPWKWIVVGLGPTLFVSMLPTLISRIVARYLPVATLLKAYGAAKQAGGEAPIQPVIPAATR